eukprot:jgi/Hompol1/6668/HPOL_000125-RA
MLAAELGKKATAAAAAATAAATGPAATNGAAGIKNNNVDVEMTPVEKTSAAPIESAEDIKDSANELFKAKKYPQAIELYTKAIGKSFAALSLGLSLLMLVFAFPSQLGLSPRTATYYGNRAAAYLMVDKFKEALSDCLVAVDIEPDFTKAHFRAAKCQVHLGNLSDAIAQLKKAQQASAPGTRIVDQTEAIQKELREIQTMQIHLDTYQKMMNIKEYRRALTSIENACIV